MGGDVRDAMLLLLRMLKSFCSPPRWLLVAQVGERPTHQLLEKE